MKKFITKILVSALITVLILAAITLLTCVFTKYPIHILLGLGAVTIFAKVYGAIDDWEG